MLCCVHTVFFHGQGECPERWKGEEAGSPLLQGRVANTLLLSMRCSPTQTEPLLCNLSATSAVGDS